MQKDGFHTEEILCVKAVFLFSEKVLTQRSLSGFVIMVEVDK